MKLNTYLLLSLAGFIAPGTTIPMPASIDKAIRSPDTTKRGNERSFEMAVGDTAAVNTRDVPNIEVQIRDPAAIEGRDIPSIEVQIRDPAAIEG